ncbi:uncharacterized protein LOC142977492 isoform X2 [Anticarsia gemmatalis]|uniref:uncharacterized protein LOC142977492 isoform X2 n=1 Tax=Anticarsia gemmatalis TaxID=129554 RepID=UPI003F76DD7D
MFAAVTVVFLCVYEISGSPMLSQSDIKAKYNGIKRHVTSTCDAGLHLYEGECRSVKEIIQMQGGVYDEELFKALNITEKALKEDNFRADGITPAEKHFTNKHLATDRVQEKTENTEHNEVEKPSKELGLNVIPINNIIPIDKNKFSKESSNETATVATTLDVLPILPSGRHDDHKIEHLHITIPNMQAESSAPTTSKPDLRSTTTSKTDAFYNAVENSTMSSPSYYEIESKIIVKVPYVFLIVGVVCAVVFSYLFKVLSSRPRTNGDKGVEEAFLPSSP